MKKILTCLGILASLTLFSQCPLGNWNGITLIPSGDSIFIDRSNGTDVMWGSTIDNSFSPVWFNSGQYVRINVTSGLIYEFSTCGSNWNTQLSLFDYNSQLLSYDTSSCLNESKITYLSTYTGEVLLQLCASISNPLGSSLLSITSVLQTNSPTVESLDVKIWPNPSDGLINIQIGSNELKTTIEIIDLSGKLIFTSLSNGTLHIHDLNLSPGIYLVNIINNNQNLTKQLIIN